MTGLVNASKAALNMEGSKTSDAQSSMESADAGSSEGSSPAAPSEPEVEYQLVSTAVAATHKVDRSTTEKSEINLQASQKLLQGDESVAEIAAGLDSVQVPEGNTGVDAMKGETAPDLKNVELNLALPKLDWKDDPSTLANPVNGSQQAFLRRSIRDPKVGVSGQLIWDETAEPVTTQDLIQTIDGAQVEVRIPLP